MDGEINWEPQSVADLAEALSRIGNEYRSIISNIFQIYNNIGRDQLWNGKNYNSIASDLFNISKSTFDDWSDYMQFTIPETIYSIAQEQASIGGGSISFSLYKVFDEIKSIELTYESPDGSQILRISQVKELISNAFSESCENAIKKIEEYNMQFEELNALNGNQAILVMYDQLCLILNKNKNILQAFQIEIMEAIELSIAKVEITNDDSINMASKITNIMNI